MLKLNNAVYYARDFAIPEKSEIWSLEKSLKKNQNLWRIYEEWEHLITNCGGGEAWIAPDKVLPDKETEIPKEIDDTE